MNHATQKIILSSQPPPPRAVARTAGEIVSCRFAKVPPWFTVDAALRVARLKSVDYLIAADGARLAGVVSVFALRAAPATDPLSRWMASAAAVSPAAGMSDALDAMAEAGADCATVADGALLLGVLGRADVERVAAAESGGFVARRTGLA